MILFLNISQQLPILRVPVEGSSEFYERNFNTTLTPVYSPNIADVKFAKQRFDFQINPRSLWQKEIDLGGFGTVKVRNLDYLGTRVVMEVYAGKGVLVQARKEIFRIMKPREVVELKSRSSSAKKST